MNSSTTTDRTEPRLDWPREYPRTDPEDREPYPGDLEPTRKKSFESVVDELERWGATDVRISTASQHYADRPNIPHQHDRPDDVGVVARFRREDAAADHDHAIACDRWATQRENARAIALYARRMRLADRCGVTTAHETIDTARLPPGDDEEAIVATGRVQRDPHEVLGVPEDAPRHVVMGAYRELAREGHPDRGGDLDMGELQRAKEAMLDE